VRSSHRSASVRQQELDWTFCGSSWGRAASIMKFSYCRSGDSHEALPYSHSDATNSSATAIFHLYFPRPNSSSNTSSVVNSKAGAPGSQKQSSSSLVVGNWGAPSDASCSLCLGAKTIRVRPCFGWVCALAKSHLPYRSNRFDSSYPLVGCWLLICRG